MIIHDIFVTGIAYIVSPSKSDEDIDDSDEDEDYLAQSDESDDDDTSSDEKETPITHTPSRRKDLLREFSRASQRTPTRRREIKDDVNMVC